MTEREDGEHEYVLGTDETELARLGLQHGVWRAQAHEHWERARVAPGARVLDVGCGPGYATLDLARLVGPKGRVTGVDVSRRFLDHVAAAAKRDGLANVTTREGDLQTLALEPASADVAWTRWVLSFVKDPGAVVANVARALAPGGRWAIQEYVSYSGMKLGPASPVLARVVDAIHRSWRAQGGEPDVGLELPRLLLAHGLEVADARPITRLARPGTSVWDWPGSYFESFVPRLVTTGFLSQADASAFLDEWRARSNDPGALFVCPTVIAITAVKPG